MLSVPCLSPWQALPAPRAGVPSRHPSTPPPNCTRSRAKSSREVGKHHATRKSSSNKAANLGHSAGRRYSSSTFPPSRSSKPEGKYSDIELTDGSRLHCKEWTIKAKQVELKTLAGQEIKLPLSAVANILNDAQEEKYRKDWAERLAAQTPPRHGRPGQGRRINPVEGTLGEADEEGKSIEMQIARRPKRARSASPTYTVFIFQRETRSRKHRRCCASSPTTIRTSSWSAPSRERRPACP